MNSEGFLYRIYQLREAISCTLQTTLKNILTKTSTNKLKIFAHQRPDIKGWGMVLQKLWDLPSFIQISWVVQSG